MSKRSRKVYFLTFSIVIKYLKIFYLSKLFGNRYWDNRISALHKKSAFKIKKTLLELKGFYVKMGWYVTFFFLISY